MKKTTTYIMALALVGILGSVGLASACGFGFFGAENRTAIEQAIKNNDFNAWKSAMAETLTQENFDKIAGRRNQTSNRMGQRTEQMPVMKAIKSGNYTAYMEAVDNTLSSGSAMTEDEFNAAVARYTTSVPQKRVGHRGGFGLHWMHH